MQDIVVVLAQIRSAVFDLRRSLRHPPRRTEYRPLPFAMIADEAVEPPVPQHLVADHVHRSGALARRHTGRPEPARQLIGLVAGGQAGEIPVE